MRKILIAVLALIAVGGVGLYLLYNNKKSAEPTSQVSSEPVTVNAKNGTVSITVEGVSIVEPFAQATLRSSVSSVVRSVSFSGTTVKQGDVVVELDDSQGRNNFGQAEFSLAQARVELEKSKLNAERAEKDRTDKKVLLDGNAISAGEYDLALRAASDAALALEASELRVRQAELALDMARKELGALKIRAPFDGTVLKTYVATGDLVAPNTAVALFGDLSRLRLIAEVDEYDIGKVQRGQRVTISGESIGDESIVSTVESISPIADVVNNISIFNVSALVENPQGKLRPGMSADFSILIASDKGLVIPSKSVSTVRGRSYVDVMENGEIVKKRVVKGADDGINTVILEGLEEGAQVVIPGATVPSSALPSAAATTGEKSVLPITVPGSGGTK